MMRYLLIACVSLYFSGFLVGQDYYIHKWEKKQLSDKFFAEGAAAADLNKDGKMDVIAGPYWYAGPDFTKKNEFYPPKEFNRKSYSDNFVVDTFDFNKDGWLDILVIGFPGKAARWYENPQGKEGHWKMHIATDVVDNESPMFVDMTGDGIPEILCGQGGNYGYAKFDPANPTAKWVFTKVNEEVKVAKFTHGLGAGDVNGDGKVDILVTDGWIEQGDSLPWKFHRVKFADHGGAQMYTYDVDGDGDNDVITSLNAHAYGLVWNEQKKDGKFERHVIMDNNPNSNMYGVAVSQLHAIELVDMNGDGLKDIVTGKRWWAHNGHDPGNAEPAAVYWFELKRDKGKVEFIPQPVDNDSGVGTQFMVRDLNGDKQMDIISSNKKGTFVHIHGKQKVDKHTYFWMNHPAMKSMGKTPQQTVDGMKLPKGFNAKVFAGEPDVVQPIAFTIDHKGRLWVVENYSYPNWAATGKDRIVIFEDTDNDGKHDTKKVFYDKLNFASGIEVGFGGVFVGSPPNLMFIPDKDGDDKPDSEPEVLLDGWAHQDTHETLNSFIWGPDGWLYGCHGVFTHSNVGKPGAPDSERKRINAGIWRYHPTKKEFEVFGEGTSNPWGVDFNDNGQAFLTCCVITHLFHIVQGGRFHRQAGRHFNPYTYQDINTIADHRHRTDNMRNFGNGEMDKAGGGHAHAGAMIYLGDNWPDQYRNSLFMNNIHGNRVNNDIMKRKGSGFVGSHGDDFMYAMDKWYRGLYLRSGPDGSVYIIDWYDRKACHQQRPKDQTNGRVYKISYGNPNKPLGDLSKMSDLELVNLQLHKNDWYVRTARRLLMERGGNAEVHAALKKIIVENADVTRKLRALWTLHVTGGLTEADALSYLVMDSEYVRAWTVQLSAENGKVSQGILSKLSSMAAEEKSPVVRLYLSSAIQRIPLDDRWGIAEGLLSHSEDSNDHNLPLVTWYGVEPMVPHNTAKAMELAGKSKIDLVSRFIYRRAAEDSKSLDALSSSLKNLDDVNKIKMIVGEMVSAFKSRAKVKAPAGWSDVHAKLLGLGDNGLKDDVISLSVKFGDKSVFPILRKTLVDEKAKMSERRWAMQTLLTGKDAKNLEAFKSVIKIPELRGMAVEGLSGIADDSVADVFLENFKLFSGNEKQAVLASLVSREAWAEKLLKAVDAKKVNSKEMNAFHLRQLAGFEKNETIKELASRHLGTIRSTSADLKKEMDKWRTLLNAKYMATANPSNGRAVYNRSCAACHELYGQGGHIGPELTGSNRKDLDYILNNVVDPNAVIGKDYQLTVLTLKDGRVVSGMIKDENANAYTVQQLGEKTIIAKSDVKNKQVLETSMMPVGLFQAIQDSEVRDLVAYLQSSRQIPLPGEKPLINPKTNSVDGAVEGEKIKVVKVKGVGTAKPQDMSYFTADKWSNKSHLWLTGAQVGTELVVEVEVDKPGKYDIKGMFTKARDYGIAEIYIDGKKAGQFDFYQPKTDERADVVNSGPLELGTYDIKSKTITFKAKIVGTNKDAEPRYMFALDCLIFEPAE